MPSILFVDDEPNVLAGLRRMLRSRRGEWEMSFCGSAADALKWLAENGAEVVVTDMRMPGMDGAQLLSRIRDLYPDTVRMILSGHSDHEMTIRAVGPAHRYLAKPCEAERLIEAIDSAIDLHRRVWSPRVRKLIESIETLPTMPDIYVELVNEMQDPSASVEDAGRIVARDLGMSAKILQLVNSSFFGLPVRVTDVPHAVALLGLGVVRPLVLSTGILKQFEGRELGGVSLGKLTNHSMEAAVTARELAKSEAGDLTMEEASDVFLGGLLHDIGRLVLAQAKPGEYARLVAETADDPMFVPDAEREVFGATHGDVGGYLLKLWGLPASVVEGVALHHEPSASSNDGFSTLTAIHAAEVLTAEEAPWDVAYFERLGLADRPAVWSSQREDAPVA